VIPCGKPVHRGKCIPERSTIACWAFRAGFLICRRARGAISTRKLSGGKRFSTIHRALDFVFSLTQNGALNFRGSGNDSSGRHTWAIRGDARDARSSGNLRDIVREADELGVCSFVIAGRETLTCPEFVAIARDLPRAIFLLVTYGLLLDKPIIERLRGNATRCHGRAS